MSFPTDIRRFAVLIAMAFVFAVGAVSTQQARAQNSRNGSAYSRFGLGSLEARGSARSQGLGGGGYALSALQHGSFSNPAAWGDMLLTRISAGALYERLSVVDAADNQSRFTEGTLNAVQFSFPILSRQLGVGFSFAPYSRVRYSISTVSDVVTDPVTGEVSEATIRYSGTGGLQEFAGGFGVKLADWLYAGATVNLLFGIIEESRRVDFLDPAFLETIRSESTRMFGVNGTGGLLLDVPRVAGERDRFSAALVFSLPAKLDGSRVVTIGESLDRDTLGTGVDGTVEIPMSVSGGVSYHPAIGVTVVLDGLYEPWTDASTALDFPGFASGSDNGLHNRSRVSGGVEIVPAGRDIFATYFRRVSYRLGFFSDQSYATPVQDISVRSRGVTLGVGLPTARPGTSLDINMSIGRRGTTDAGLVRDKFVRLGLNLNIGERWFVKRRIG